MKSQSTSTPINWGILGTGFVAQKFADALLSFSDTQLWAVGSRNLSNAEKFANQFKAKKAYGNYLELVQDPQIDIVYVATPHIRHKEDCLLCLEAGKAVLCEKPFTVNAQEAREVIEYARQRGLFCMEGMWLRFMPLIRQIKEIVDNGEIGTISMLTADFGYPTEFDPNNRFFNLESAGGALLDRGVYTLSLAFFLLNSPSTITSKANISVTGVDEQLAIILEYNLKALAQLSCSLTSYLSNRATIIGTKGNIIIHEPFYQPDQISITKFSDKPVVYSLNTYKQSSEIKQKIISFFKKSIFLKNLLLKLKKSQKVVQYQNQYNPLYYEIDEVVNCLKEGRTESKIMSLDETLKIMEVLDEIRQQINLRYPQD